MNALTRLGWKIIGRCHVCHVKRRGLLADTHRRWCYVGRNDWPAYRIDHNTNEEW